jgi:hypothetical protein
LSFVCVVPLSLECFLPYNVSGWIFIFRVCERRLVWLIARLLSSRVDVFCSSPVSLLPHIKRPEQDSPDCIHMYEMAARSLKKKLISKSVNRYCQSCIPFEHVANHRRYFCPFQF